MGEETSKLVSEVPKYVDFEALESKTEWKFTFPVLVCVRRTEALKL